MCILECRILSYITLRNIYFRSTRVPAYICVCQIFLTLENVHLQVYYYFFFWKRRRSCCWPHMCGCAYILYMYTHMYTNFLKINWAKTATPRRTPRMSNMLKCYVFTYVSVIYLCLYIIYILAYIKFYI